MKTSDLSARRPVGRPRADGKPPLSRDAVFAVAVRLISTHGYAGTSLRMIADELGASAPSISQMFKTKQRMLTELVQSMSAVSIHFHEALAEMDLPPGVRLYKMVFEETRAVASANASAMSIFVLPELRQPEFVEAQQARRQMIAFYQTTVADGVSAGEFVALNPVVTAEQVFALTETSVTALSRKSLGQPARLAEDTAALVLRGFLSQPRKLARIIKAAQQIELSMLAAK